MSPLRVAALALLAVAAAALLWQAIDWRGLAGSPRGDEPRTAAAPETAPAATPAPLQVRTWRDEQGVVHFEQAGSAPAGASRHAVGSGGTLADYERALQEKEGISVEDIARARAAREAQPEAGTAARSDRQASDDFAKNASDQAYDLMRRYEESLGRIREANQE